MRTLLNFCAKMCICLLSTTQSVCLQNILRKKLHISHRLRTLSRTFLTGPDRWQCPSMFTGRCPNNRCTLCLEHANLQTRAPQVKPRFASNQSRQGRVICWGPTWRSAQSHGVSYTCHISSRAVEISENPSVCDLLSLQSDAHRRGAIRGPTHPPSHLKRLSISASLWQSVALLDH